MKTFNTNMKVAKKYVDKLELIEKDIDGLWAYTNKGWRFAHMDSHTAHEDNQKDLYRVIQSLESCDCKDCMETSEV